MNTTIFSQIGGILVIRHVWSLLWNLGHCCGIRQKSRGNQEFVPLEISCGWEFPTRENAASQHDFDGSEPLGYFTCITVIHIHSIMCSSTENSVVKPQVEWREAGRPRGDAETGRTGRVFALAPSKLLELGTWTRARSFAPISNPAHVQTLCSRKATRNLRQLRPIQHPTRKLHRSTELRVGCCI